MIFICLMFVHFKPLNGGEASTSHDASKSTSAAGAGAMIRLQLGEVSLSQIGKLDNLNGYTWHDGRHISDMRFVMQTTAVTCICSNFILCFHLDFDWSDASKTGSTSTSSQWSVADHQRTRSQVFRQSYVMLLFDLRTPRQQWLHVMRLNPITCGCCISLPCQLAWLVFRTQRREKKN